MPDTTLRNVPGMKSASPVPLLQAQDLSESVFMEEYVSHGRPCIIKGAARHWAAVQKWRDKEYLKNLSGHHDIYYYPYEYRVSAKMMESGRLVMPFAEAVDRFHSPETKIAIVTTAALPELVSDLGDFSFLGRMDPAYCYPQARYFFYRNAGTTWHYHPFDETLMCQIVGSKKIGLLNTDNPHNMAIRELFYKEDYYNDPSAFARLGGAELPWFLATIEEGDALYIPPLWWHGVVPVGESFGATATMTFRSPEEVDAQVIRKMAAGEIDMIGETSSTHFQSLGELARKMGVERELEIAWARWFFHNIQN